MDPTFNAPNRRENEKIKLPLTLVFLLMTQGLALTADIADNTKLFDNTKLLDNMEYVNCLKSHLILSLTVIATHP